ncbi:MAG: type VI secretion system baseplate subunit TssE [Telmatospirillum sp.]|nr:type VI secretion system baseplate subunit TssE [Telmatospirillum sp.]
MTPDSRNISITPSLLDRLTQAPEGARSFGAALDHLKQSLRRDLEALLNTRRRPGPPGDGLPELARSPIRYGIPDFVAVNMAAQERQAAFGKTLERVIRDFEPRLANVSVTLMTPAQAPALTPQRSLSFRIEAVLRVEPAPEPVIFESVLDPISRTFSIKGTIDG